MDYPKLRNVNVFPVQMSGKRMVCLQDPLNVSEKSLFLPFPLYFVISLFDGNHSILDIQAEYMRQFGELLYRDRIEEIIKEMEEACFLEGDRFEEALRKKEDEFRQASTREPTLAGKSYEKEPDRLVRQIEGYFTHPEGPGLPEGKKADGLLQGVVIPHIDYHRGGICYAFGHREIGERSDASCFVILGTAHVPMKHAFALTRKAFSTPLGFLETEQELIDSIQSRCSYDLFEDEGAHRSEHSIEFQCIFLRFLSREGKGPRIVPILCGSLHEAIARRISPMEFPPVREFIEALRASLSSWPKKICVIASADLSHVGLQFGDRQGMGEYDLVQLEQEDRDMLHHVEKGDGEGFFSFVAREQDRRRICGLPAIYTLLQTLGSTEGRLLKYGQAFTRETQSVVTFASLGLYRLDSKTGCPIP